MARIPTIITGDDVLFKVYLKKDGLPFVIDAGATVLASIVNTRHTASYMTPVAMSPATFSADWDNSEVMIKFDPADTAGITYQGKALLEVQVDDGGKQTYFGTVQIVTGLIA